MIGEGVRERSQRKQKKNILFLTPSLFVFSFDLGSAFIWLYPFVACATNRTKTSSSLSVNQCQNCWSGPVGGYLGIFWVGMYRPGLQIGTPF